MDSKQTTGVEKDTIFSWTNDNKYKVVLVGDSGVGKTSIFWQYIEEYFPDDVSELKVTMVDFKIKNIIIENELIKMYIWDTAGQERYRALVSNYFKGTHGILMVFDLGSLASFESIKSSWFNICRDKSPHANYILIGNKADLPQRGVSASAISEFSNKHNLTYFEVSAFDGQNVSEAFDRMAHDIKSKFFPKEVPKNLLDDDSGDPPQRGHSQASQQDQKSAMKPSSESAFKPTNQTNKQNESNSQQQARSSSTTASTATAGQDQNGQIRQSFALKRPTPARPAEKKAKEGSCC